MAGLLPGDHDRRWICSHPCYEGAYLYRRDGWWYLFVSAGSIAWDEYHLCCGRSRTLDGDFVDSKGVPLAKGGGDTLLVSNATFPGPGHNGEIFTDRAGRDYLFFHSPDRTGDRRDAERDGRFAGREDLLFHRDWTIRLIFKEDGKWISLMTWAAVCYRLKPQDLEIGWNRAMCAKRLKLIASNRRFTILNEKGARPNLGSQLLGMAMRELPAIWKRKWGYSPLLAETFCDIERTAGTCYRAAGWKAVGKTRGFSRVEKLAGHVRAHWYVEVYHGKRDNGYHEDKLTRRLDLNIMSAMMVARSLGMWVCARSPGKSAEAVQRDLLRHPSKLMRIMTKGGLL